MFTMPVAASKISQTNVAIARVRRGTIIPVATLTAYLARTRSQAEKFLETVQGIIQSTTPTTVLVGFFIRKLRAKMLTMEIGVTSLATDGLATAMPATALVTETAGVKIPSARVKAVPNRHWYKLVRDASLRLNRNTN